MSTDPAAETETEVDVPCPKIKKKKERKTKTAPENAAGAKKDGTIVKGRIGAEDHPGIKIGDREVQTETELETRTEADAPEADAPEADAPEADAPEADAPEAGVIGETRAKTDRLIEKIEKLPAKGGDAAAAAAALRVIEQIRGRAKRAPIPKEELIVLPNPKTEEAQPDQIVQKSERETIARGRSRALAPALTAIDIFFSCFYIYPQFMQYATPAFHLQWEVFTARSSSTCNACTSQSNRRLTRDTAADQH